MEKTSGKISLGLASTVAVAAVIVLVGIGLSLEQANETANSQVRQALKVSSPAVGMLATYMREKSELPTALSETGFVASLPEFITSIEISPNGAIRTVFSTAAEKKLVGKQLLRLPSIGRDGYFQWACGSPDIEADFMPDDCRSKELSSKIGEQLAARKMQARLAAAEEAKRKYELALIEVRQRFPGLDPNGALFNQTLFDKVQVKIKQYVEQDAKSDLEALKLASNEVMFADAETQREISAAKFKKDQDSALLLAAKQRQYASEQLKAVCKFGFYGRRDGRWNDDLGIALAEAAKKECLNNDGQQGSAYVRWRDHMQMMTSRANQINKSANDNINNLLAPKPRSNLNCDPIGGGRYSCR